MKKAPLIVEARAWRVSVPLLEEWVCSPEFGAHPVSDRLVLQVVDGEGFEGWGEGPWNVGAEVLKTALERLCGDEPWVRTSFLDGLCEPSGSYWSQPAGPSPHAARIENLRHRLRHPMQVAAETALLDLAGKRAGLPLGAFFGGAWRDRVAVDYWMGRGTPDLAARCAQRAVELGFSGLKMKTTLEDPTVEKLEAIRGAAGVEFGVTVDPNGRFYRLDDAWATIRAMEAVGNLRILEDPFPRTALSETKALRERISARVVIHIDPPEMLAEVLRSEVCGGLNIDSHTQGLFGWRMQAAAADAFNLPVWHGSGNDLGIFTAAQLHLAASAPNCQLPGDQAGPWIRESTLVEETFTLENGHVRVPTGPGLGVTVDRAALDSYGVLAGEVCER
jgi:L-rhamnonate dehydratase